LFFIVHGKALIESARGLKFAEVSEGDICGEMSFLEDTIAAARVVAEENVDTLAIEWTTLHQLFQTAPSHRFPLLPFPGAQPLPPPPPPAQGISPHKSEVSWDLPGVPGT